MRNTILLLFFILSPLSFVHANPKGANIKQGVVHTRTQDNLIEIQASDRSIIHWEDFSIHTNETTRFIQPNPTSAVLNYVTGMNISSINGLLEANGRIILINPNGVIIGKDGIIRAADFIASTHHIIDLEDWSIQSNGSQSIHLQGNTPTAAINHEGIIEASGIAFQDGKILLVADRINIQGALTAPLGHIEITALDSLYINGFIDASKEEEAYGTITINAPTLLISHESDLTETGIATSSIKNALNQGNHILLQTTADSEHPHTLTWNPDSPITWNNSSQLTLKSHDTLLLSSNIQCRDEGSISIESLYGSVCIGPPAPNSTTFIDTQGAIQIQAGNHFMMQSGQIDEDVRLRQIQSTSHPISIQVFNGNATLNAIEGNSSCQILAEGPLNITIDQGSLILNTDQQGQITLYTHEDMNIVAQHNIQGFANQYNGIDPNIWIHVDSISGAESLIQATEGEILFHAGDHSGKWQLTQNNSATTFKSGGNCSLISHSDLPSQFLLGKDTTFQIGGDLLIETHKLGNITLTESKNFIFNIDGNMTYRSHHNANIEIIAGKTINAHIGDTFLLEKLGYISTFPDIFFAAIGSNMIHAGNDVIIGNLSTIGSGNGPITIKTHQNIAMLPTSSISLLSFIPGARNPITLVIDDHASIAPQIGNGRFIMHPNSHIGTDPQAIAPVRIFTARRDQNIVQGQINHTPLKPGAFNINTDTEQWGSHFTNTFFIPTESTFTFFYKEPQLGHALFALSQTIGKSFIALEPFTYPQSFYDDHFFSSQTNSTRILAKNKKLQDPLLKKSIASEVIQQPIQDNLLPPNQ